MTMLPRRLYTTGSGYVLMGLIVRTSTYLLTDFEKVDLKSMLYYQHQSSLSFILYLFQSSLNSYAVLYLVSYIFSGLV